MLVGLLTVRVIEAGTPPGSGFPLDTVMVGRLAFEANAGVARGMRKTIAEIARSARIVPELIFVKYAFVGVFMFIFG